MSFSASTKLSHIHRSYIAGIIGYLQPCITQKFLAFQSRHIAELTSREKECIKWISVGKTSWEVSKILGVSERTINFHINNAMRKTDTNTRLHLVTKSIQLGLLNT